MYGLRRIGELAAKTHGQEVKDFIVNDFYVDDGLKSCATTYEAVSLIHKTQDAMKEYVSSENKPSTRRGVLSVVNRLYDPLGFIAPVIVQGKIILRKVVSDTSDWDEALPDYLLEEWEKWKNDLPDLEKLQIPRVIVPNLSEAHRKELLIFCDASELAIAAVCYLKVHYPDGSTSQGFVLGKAKVAPVSGHTIPRLELCAAVLAVNVGQTAKEQLKIEIDDVKYFSDSRIVLGYINNAKKRFFVYVANTYCSHSQSRDPSQWSYIRSEINPADKTDIITSEEHFPLVSPEEDKEIRCNKTDIETKSAYGLSNDFLTKFSKWNKLVAVVVKVYGFIQKCRKAESMMSDVDLLCKAEMVIIRDIQQKFYSEEIENLQDSKPLSKNSPIQKLDPYIDSEGILRVGGRLRNLSADASFKNPMILPAKHHVTTLIVRKLHSDVKHQGRHITEGHIRSSGFWIVGGKRLVSSVLHKCITCRKLRKVPEYQKMSNLPEDRLIPGQPPFSNVGVDIFGPWNIITRRNRGGAANSKKMGCSIHLPRYQGCTYRSHRGNDIIFILDLSPFGSFDLTEEQISFVLPVSM
ncbi:uncharacterized protein LOC134276399 [Saccostrea cucullata]|uniref:uncharacterized protein LOC134276399 n=1 Tax=Saccostrea cuccullata TaxID=36930 RepID=UPI002ED1DD0F